MEGEVNTGVSPSTFLSGWCSDEPGMPRKRNFRGFRHVRHEQESLNWSVNPSDSNGWNPKAWDWDSVNFTAKPSFGATEESVKTPILNKGLEADDGEDLSLKLGFREELDSRTSKRVRSGSPGSAANYPKCQVDDCRTDLSSAKDYHRRHKVCEIHSKMAKAVVGRKIQRFCQQCSRFHPLSEFDEGKRSCRRRLAGHNRRRRKTQPENASPNINVPGILDGKPNGNIDIANLLSLLVRLQGDAATMVSLPEKSQLRQIFDKFGGFPPANPSSETFVRRDFDLNFSEAPLRSCESENPIAPSTRNLLACWNSVANTDPEKKPAQSFPQDGCGENDFNAHFQFNSSEQIAAPRMSLQIFGSSEDNSPAKLGSASKYPSSQSSNLIEDRSPSCSPPTMAKRLSVLQSASERRDESLMICRAEDRLVQKLPYQGGSSSSSGSGQSPCSSNGDAQDRTGRIIFKLFDKDPSNLPGTLRTEILNWLSLSPSEIESHIRPGCVVLSIYLCMASVAWNELEENFLRRVQSLVRCSDSGFWKNARFLIRTNSQLASHNNGIIRVCKSRKTWGLPELTLVSPIAVIGGKETTLILKGRNLTLSGTIIHSTFNGGYSSKDVQNTTNLDTLYDDSYSECFILYERSSSSYGRYFIEVDNGFKGNSFPLIIADGAICQELRSLEPELEDDDCTIDARFQDQCLENGRPRSREDILHFLNELGWLFQRKSHHDSPLATFSNSRFKNLFLFSVERDFCAVIKKLLDILAERGSESDSMSNERLKMVHDLNLLNRAVERRCRKMVDLLVDYSVKNESSKGLRVYIFPPNSSGHVGFTPLHLAASMQNAEGLVDALTNDPQEIGLTCWDSLLDDSGRSPAMHASSTNNRSYNILVTRKLADKKNNRVSISIEQEERFTNTSMQPPESLSKHTNGCGPATLTIKSCTRCALAESQLTRKTRGKGLLNRPYIASMLGIAAVCVCVCLFLRGTPWVGVVAPFKWENLGCGPR